MEFVTWMTFLIEQWTISFKPLSILLVVKKPGFKTSLQKRGGPGKEVGRSQDYTNHPIFKKVLDFTKYSVTWEISIKILRGLVSRLLALTPIFSVGGLEEVFLQDLLRLTPVLYHISSTRVMSHHSDITTNSHRLFFDAFIKIFDDEDDIFIFFRNVRKSSAREYYWKKNKIKKIIKYQIFTNASKNNRWLLFLMNDLFGIKLNCFRSELNVWSFWICRF